MSDDPYIFFSIVGLLIGVPIGVAALLIVTFLLVCITGAILVCHIRTMQKVSTCLLLVNVSVVHTNTYKIA